MSRTTSPASSSVLRVPPVLNSSTPAAARPEANSTQSRLVAHADQRFFYFWQRLHVFHPSKDPTKAGLSRLAVLCTYPDWGFSFELPCYHMRKITNRSGSHRFWASSHDSTTRSPLSTRGQSRVPPLPTVGQLSRKGATSFFASKESIAGPPRGPRVASRGGKCASGYLHCLKECFSSGLPDSGRTTQPLGA